MFKDTLSTMALVKSFVAEFIGTFFLALVVLTVSAGSFSDFAPFMVGGVVGLMVYLLGQFSGAQFNPSVSIGLLFSGLMPIRQFIVNVCGQILGAFAAFEFGARFLELELSPSEAWNNPWIFELLGAFILSFAVAAVVRKRVPDALSGVVIGGALVLGIIIAENGSGAILNPALAGGLGLYSWPFLIAPLLGGIAAQYLYWFLDKLY